MITFGRDDSDYELITSELKEEESSEGSVALDEAESEECWILSDILSLKSTSYIFFCSRQKRVALKAKNFQKHVHILNWFVSNYMKFTMSHFVIIQSSRNKTIHIFTFWRRKVEWIFFRALKPSLPVSASLRLRQWTQPHRLRRVFQAGYLLRP